MHCRCVQNPAESFVVFRVKARSACQSLHKRKHARVDARAVDAQEAVPIG